MKRKVFALGALIGTMSLVNAQTTEVTNKNGVIVTPQAGDIAIGFDATPFFNYIGNSFNGTVNNSIGTSFVNGSNAIYGKYFLDENTAIRGTVRIMTMSAKDIDLQDTTGNPANAPSYVENSVKYSGSNFVLGGGIEKRRGHGRLQGYYGADALLTFGGSVPNETYSYALDMNEANFNAGYVMNGRTLSYKAGGTLGFGARGFIGGEYFFAPKISIGAEFGWGLMFSKTKNGEETHEYWGLENSTATTASRFERTVQTGGSSAFGFDTDNWGGSIRLMIHF
jgi:hypothetical protein